MKEVYRSRHYKDFTFKMYISENTKYLTEHKDCRLEKYKGVKSVVIVKGGDESIELEKMFDEEDCDIFHSYIILHLVSGKSLIFKESYTDMVVE